MILESIRTGRWHEFLVKCKPLCEDYTLASFELYCGTCLQGEVETLFKLLMSPRPWQLTFFNLPHFLILSFLIFEAYHRCAPSEQFNFCGLNHIVSDL